MQLYRKSRRLADYRTTHRRRSVPSLSGSSILNPLSPRVPIGPLFAPAAVASVVLLLVLQVAPEGPVVFSAWSLADADAGARVLAGRQTRRARSHRAHAGVTEEEKWERLKKSSRWFLYVKHILFVFPFI